MTSRSITALSIGLVLVLGLLSVAGVYVTDHGSAYVRSFARTLNLPFGAIDGSRVGFASVYRNVAALQALSDAEEPRSALVASVWQKLQRDRALETIFGELKLSWDEGDFESFAQAYIAGVFGTEEELAQLIKPLSTRDFRQDVIRPLYLERAISKKMIFDGENQSYGLILELYTRAQAEPERFDEIAQQYAESLNLPSIQTDVLLTADDFPAETVDMLRTVADGSLTPIIASYDGYHVYYILQHFTEPEEAWQAKELFVADNSLQEKLSIALKNLKMRVFNERLLNNE